MQKNFNRISIIIAVLLCSKMVIAQTKTLYKDVLLNGKPARLNTVTGEFILINGKKIDTIKTIQLNSISTSADKNTTKNSLSTNQNNATNNKQETNDNTDVHVVKAGETLFLVSKIYNVSLNKLKQVNNLETTLIHVGQKLRVKNFDEVATTPNTIRVAKGNTLYNISITYGITINALKQLNGLSDNTIYIGQELRLK